MCRRQTIEKSTAKCVLQVFIWAEMATETGATYGLSLLCSSNNPVMSHSLRRLSPSKWPLIKREFVLMEWRLSFTAALLLITEREVTDTCQNTGWGGRHMVQFYKYLGVHINNRPDRTNKTYCARGGRILFFKTIASISGGQHTVLCSGREQQSEGCRQDVHQPSGKRKYFYCLNLDDLEAAGETETKNKPNFILDNISHHLYGVIRQLLKHPKVAAWRSLGSHFFHPPTDSFVSKWPFSLCKLGRCWSRPSVLTWDYQISWIVLCINRLMTHQYTVCIIIYAA